MQQLNKVLIKVSMVLALGLVLFGCPGMMSTQIHLFDQAQQVSADIADTVRAVLPQPSESADYSEERDDGFDGGYALYSGSCSYNQTQYAYGDYTIDRIWSNFGIEFHDYTSACGLTIEDGTLDVTADCSSGSGIDATGDLSISGTITVSGRYEDEDIRDTATVNFDCQWKSMINQGSTLCNSEETFDIWMPY